MISKKQAILIRKQLEKYTKEVLLNSLNSKRSDRIFYYDIDIENDFYLRECQINHIKSKILNSFLEPFNSFDDQQAISHMLETINSNISKKTRDEKSTIIKCLTMENELKQLSELKVKLLNEQLEYETEQVNLRKEKMSMHPIHWIKRRKIQEQIDSLSVPLSESNKRLNVVDREINLRLENLKNVGIDWRQESLELYKQLFEGDSPSITIVDDTDKIVCPTHLSKSPKLFKFQSFDMNENLTYDDSIIFNFHNKNIMRHSQDKEFINDKTPIEYYMQLQPLMTHDNK